MTEEQLVQVNQDLGRDVDAIRDQRRAIVSELGSRIQAREALRLAVQSGDAQVQRNEDGSVTVSVTLPTISAAAPEVGQ